MTRTLNPGDAIASSAKTDEVHLMSRFAAGDVDAAAELYDRHAGQIFALARRILHDDGEAEDIVQEVFSQAWKTARRFHADRGSIVAWLLVMTRSRSIDRLRARRARPDVITDPYLEWIPDDSMPASEQLLSEEQAARIREALTGLPPAQRSALELAYYEGLTHSEIASRLTEPLGTIKTRIRSALITLRQRLTS